MKNGEAIHKGIEVRFHPIIGSRHDCNLYVVTDIDERGVWLEGKADPADPRSISIPTPGVDNYGGCQE
jgi:hypothetical protein